MSGTGTFRVGGATVTVKAQPEGVAVRIALPPPLNGMSKAFTLTPAEADALAADLTMRAAYARALAAGADA